MMIVGAEQYGNGTNVGYKEIIRKLKSEYGNVIINNDMENQVLVYTHFTKKSTLNKY